MIIISLMIRIMINKDNGNIRIMQRIMLMAVCAKDNDNYKDNDKDND